MNSFSGFTGGLAIAGGVLLLLLALHGWWRWRQTGPSLPRRTQVAERQEPVFDEELPDLAGLPAIQPGSNGAGAVLDALIDVIVPLHLEEPVSGHLVLAQTPPTRRLGSKPFSLEGWNEGAQCWERVVADRRYEALQAGVQLANRNGALNEIEYSEFVAVVQALADHLGATPEFPDMQHEVARARELDQFASTHDAQLDLSLRARGAAWSPAYVQQQAAKLGFVAGVLPGRMVLPSHHAGAAALLSLTMDAPLQLSQDAAHSALRDCKLSLEVTQVDRSEQAFALLRQVGAALAQAMDAELTDQEGKPLSAQALDAIAADLERLYETLDLRDLSAGSPQARRLFS